MHFAYPPSYSLVVSTNFQIHFRYLLTSQMQPTKARKVFPCLDEPGFKAMYDVTVARKDPYTVKTNGALRTSGPEEYVLQSKCYINAPNLRINIKTNKYMNQYCLVNRKVHY